MNFDKAIKELIAGKKIRRKDWEELRYLQMDEGKVIAYQGEYTEFYNDADVLLSTGWLVVDGDGTSMTFVEAIEHLRAKKCITKESMGESFIFINHENLTMCKPVPFMFMPTWKCLGSQDWEVMK